MGRNDRQRASVRYQGLRWDRKGGLAIQGPMSTGPPAAVFPVTSCSRLPEQRRIPTRVSVRSGVSVVFLLVDAVVVGARANVTPMVAIVTYSDAAMGSTRTSI